MKTNLLLLTTALLLTFSGCSGASGGAGTGSDGPVLEEQVKETIPLEEEEVDRRSAVMAFNSCLEDAGFTFRGFAGDDETDDAVTGDPAYQAALQRCNAESGIGDPRAESVDSRAARTSAQLHRSHALTLEVVHSPPSLALEH